MCNYVASHTHTHTHTQWVSVDKMRVFLILKPKLSTSHDSKLSVQSYNTKYTFHILHVTMHIHSCKYACTYIVHLYMYMHDMHMHMYIYMHVHTCTCIFTTSVYVFARKFYRKIFTFLWQYQVWVISNEFKFHRITTKLNYVLDYSETQYL